MSDSGTPPPGGPDPCAGCEAAGSRRAFVREAALLVAGSLVALGALPAGAAALPVRFGKALGSSGAEKTYPIPAADGVSIDKEESVIIARYQNVVYAFSLACTHQRTALKYDAGDKQFNCPKHHSAFHLDGVYIPDSGRATRGMDRFAIRKDGANVAVDFDKMYREDESAAQWKAAVIQL